MIILSPTGSYQIDLPDDVLQEDHDLVASFWRPSSDCALQLSSRSQTGDQVSAKQRIRDKIAFAGGRREPFLHFEHKWAPDFAGTVNLKEDGWIWTHIYLVWSDLSVYATISKPPYEAPNVDRWAIETVNSLKSGRISAFDCRNGHGS
jgi:hypothetical protein